ncbi:tetratricopeptide repeat protein [bacterium]|nr:tetratricopeptide repeat protein [bacterium]
MNSNKSKIISATLLFKDIKNDPYFVKIPGEISTINDIKETVIKKYQTENGILENFIDEDKIILQWYPNNINQEAESLYHESSKYMKLKQSEKAIECLKKAISMNKEEVQYLYKVALIFYEMKKFNDSVKYLKNTVHICPIYYKAHLLLGINLIKLRKFDQAELHILQSKRLNSSSASSYLNLGVIYSIQKKFNEAIEMFNYTIQILPKETRAYLGLAKIYNILNDVEAANKYFGKVIEIAPGTHIAEYAKRSINVNYENEANFLLQKNNGKQLSRGLELYLTGKYTDASNIYKEYLNTNPSDDYTWYLFGETKLRTGNLKESLDCFRRAVKLNPKRGLYYKSLCIPLHFLDKSDETIEVIKKAIELGKKDALTYTILGIHLMKLNKLEESKNSLNRALKKYPVNPLAIYYLTLIQLKLNEKNNALKSIKNLLETEVYTPLKNQAKKIEKNI